MNDPSYLFPTIQTLSDSLSEQSTVSTHDIIDAYATFANRIRSHGHLLRLSDTHLPALDFLKIHSDVLVRALRRDLCLAHIDPFSPRFSLDEISLHLNLDIITKQYARDSSSLCHHALCALTTIFRFPAFHSVFFDDDLSSLFGQVLDIALADQLPVLNAAKTYSLSLWALSCHSLPGAVLSSRRDDMYFALQRSLDRARQPVNIVLDGIKAISHTIEHHPSEFIHLLSPLLPHLVTHLLRGSSELRLHASIALGKFANLLISHSELSLTIWQTQSDCIISSLEPYCGESQVASEDKSLPHIVRTAFSAEPYAHPGDAPTWILAVLASLIILCGPALYRKPTVLCFILRSLGMGLTHERSVIRALHPHVWRCLVWTFSQMLLSPEDVDSALLSSAFYVIKQEVSGGIGVALANVLLSDRISTVRPDERNDRVSQALSVIKAMVQTGCKHTRREGFMFLQAFANDAQVRHQITQNAYEIPASVLLNGVIIGAEWDSLPSIIHSIPKVPLVVHWLEETEVAQHYMSLLVIWKHFATKVDKEDLDSSLVDVWLSVLLACSHQLEYQQHISAPTEVLRSSAAIIAEFLPSVPLGECQPDWGSWSVHDQLCRLTFIDRLWSAMRKAFATLSLTEAAELILISILKYAFHVLDPGVRTLWSGLSASLMATVSPSFLRDVDDLTASQLVIRNQRELWGVVATSLSFSELDLDWKDLVKFLAIPVCTWILSENELEVWEALLRNAITISGDFATVTEILKYFQEREVENWGSIIPVLGFLLTSIRERGNSPTDELLSMLDVCLIVSYSRARHSPEELMRCLELLNVIRRVIVSTPGEVMHILQALCNSLCLWIEDQTEVMSNDEFNSVAVSLYCETLKALEVLPLSIQYLQKMENFLASAFSRIPTPAIAPFAFENFWRATYHGRSQFCNTLPPKVKSCLTCFVAAYGGDLADGLSLTTESQSQQSISDGSNPHFATSYRHRRSGELNPQANPLSMSTHTGVCAEVSDMNIAPHGGKQMFSGQGNTTSLPDDNTPQLTVLRQLQEYSSQTDAPFPDGSERSMSGIQRHFPSIPSASSRIPSSPSPKEPFPAATYTSHRKRKFADGDDAPQKRSRASRAALRTFRKLESEPATRDVTPASLPRMNSMPLKKRMVFDGVHVPTLRVVERCRKMVRRTETGKSIIRTEQDLASTPHTPSSHGRNRALPSTLPPSAESNEENFDWEDFRVDATPQEVEVDPSLVDVHPSLPLWARAATPHEPGDESYPPSGLSQPKAMSQDEVIPSAPLQRVKTTSARLDALRDIYSSVTSGVSQIPMSELLQATRLVHQIGAVLTEQMGKKMSDPGR